MRYASVLLALFALPGLVVAQLQFLTVEDIFQAISFVAAHPASPKNFVSISPFGPESDETRMPETFDDVAKHVLHCYHHDARYQAADVAQTPWDGARERGTDHSALIRIRYLGATSDDAYEIDVGLVSREDRIRAVVVSDTFPEHWDAHCGLEDWTKLAS